jgi:hypothetical protein
VSQPRNVVRQVGVPLSLFRLRHQLTIGGG